MGTCWEQPWGPLARWVSGQAIPRCFLAVDVWDVPRLTPADEDVAPGVAPVTGESEQQQCLQVQPLHQQPVEIGQH